MTPLTLVVALVVAMTVSGAVVVVLRSRLHPEETMQLTFDTTPARTRQGWAAFWARDPFVRAQLQRKGIAFGTYTVPGREAPIATHLAAPDLQQHALILGATGSGKSSLLESLALVHLRQKQGFAMIDLHGDLFTRVAAWALVTKPSRLVLLDFTRPDLLPGWNPLTQIDGIDVGRQVGLIANLLKKLYAGEDASSWSWGPKTEEIMRYSIRACIESAAPMSLVDLPSFLLIPGVQRLTLATASEESRSYFTTRYGNREKFFVSAALNKLEPLLSSMAVSRFLGQPYSTFDVLGAIDRGDTVLVNLAKGYLGPAADFMGRLLVNALQAAALRRERVTPAKRRPYMFLLDEAHVLAAAGSGLEDFLVAARKYKVFVTLAAQGLSLFPPNFRPHLLGNTARQFFFRLPHSEAQMLARDIFEPLGSVWREPTRPNDAVDDPLLTPTEEIAWRTRELSSLPVGACYWYLKDRPFKARRVQVLKPLDLPFRERELRERIDAAMAATKRGLPLPPLNPTSASAMHAAQMAERTARRNLAAGIAEDDATPSPARTARSGRSAKWIA